MLKVFIPTDFQISKFEVEDLISTSFSNGIEETLDSGVVSGGESSATEENVFEDD